MPPTHTQLSSPAVADDLPLATGLAQVHGPIRAILWSQRWGQVRWSRFGRPVLNPLRDP